MVGKVVLDDMRISTGERFRFPILLQGSLREVRVKPEGEFLIDSSRISNPKNVRWNIWDGDRLSVYDYMEWLYVPLESPKMLFYPECELEVEVTKMGEPGILIACYIQPLKISGNIMFPHGDPFKKSC